MIIHHTDAGRNENYYCRETSQLATHKSGYDTEDVLYFWLKEFKGKELDFFSATTNKSSSVFLLLEAETS